MALIVIAWGVSAGIGSAAPAQRALVALSEPERAAMGWVQANTPSSSRFLVVSPVGWALDRESEWFPALSDRESVATVQGTEWVPSEFRRREDAHVAMRPCASQGASCLDTWTHTTGIPFTHVYLPLRPDGDCCAPLRASLAADPHYETLFSGPGASVFHRR
jgi:hypothetical protein